MKTYYLSYLVIFGSVQEASLRLCLQRLLRKEHKLRTLIERTNTESSSKYEVDSKNAKTSFFKSDGKSQPSKNNTLKTKLSDESIAKIFRNITKVHKTFTCAPHNVDVSEGLNVREKAPETKKDSKGRSLLLQQVSRQQKQVSELDLLRSKSKIPPEKKTVLSNICNSFPVHKPAPLYHRPQNSPKERNSPEKSLSFDSLKFLNRPKTLCKCFSLDNEKIPDNPLGVFNVVKKSFIPSSESTNPNVNHNPEATFLCASDKPWEKSITITQEILNARNRSLTSSTSGCKIRELQNKTGSVLTAAELERYQKYLGRDSQNEQVDLENIDLESLLTNVKSSNHSDPVRRCNDESLKESAEKTLQICQCLHFHTEEGFRKLSLHNNPTTEYGNKFFRVNYYPRDKDEDEEDVDSRIELVDKETITENDAETEEISKIRQANSIPETVRKKRSEKKVPASLKVTSQNYRKSITKVQEKGKKKEPVEGPPSEFELRQSLGQPDRKDSLPPPRRNKEMKVCKPGGMKQRRVQPLKTFSHIMKEEMKQKKALEELITLEKLFTKLNSVEISLYKRKAMSTKKILGKYPEAKLLTRKLETNPVTESNGKFFVDNEAEEEYQRRRRRLRSAIIQHVQNWLELDYSSL